MILAQEAGVCVYLENPESGLELVALLPDLRRNKMLDYLALVGGFSAGFKNLDVPVRILYIDGHPSNDPDFLWSQDDGTLFREYGFFGDKVIFGQTVHVPMCGLVLCTPQKVVALRRRITTKNLELLWVKALDCQVQMVRKKHLAEAAKITKE